MIDFYTSFYNEAMCAHRNNQALLQERAAAINKLSVENKRLTDALVEAKRDAAARLASVRFLLGECDVLQYQRNEFSVRNNLQAETIRTLRNAMIDVSDICKVFFRRCAIAPNTHRALLDIECVANKALEST